MGTDRARPGRARTMGWAVGAAAMVTALVAAGCSGGDDGPAQPEVRPQAWKHVAGTCPPPFLLPQTMDMLRRRCLQRLYAPDKITLSPCQAKRAKRAWKKRKYSGS